MTRPASSAAPTLPLPLGNFTFHVWEESMYDEINRAPLFATKSLGNKDGYTSLNQAIVAVQNLTHLNDASGAILKQGDKYVAFNLGTPSRTQKLVDFGFEPNPWFEKDRDQPKPVPFGKEIDYVSGTYNFRSKNREASLAAVVDGNFVQKFRPRNS